MKVPSSSRPLPQESFFSGNSSGSRPYLDGPKNELWTPIKNTQPSSNGIWFHQKPASARSITPISKIFTLTLIVRLLKRSAKKPPAMENRMNGSENRAVTSSPTRCNSAVDTFMPRIMNTTSHLRTLSLKAPWNCVTKSAQKPRRRPEASGVWRPGSGVRGPGSGIRGSVTASKLTLYAATCELKNFWPASSDAMASGREGPVLFHNLWHKRCC